MFMIETTRVLIYLVSNILILLTKFNIAEYAELHIYALIISALSTAQSVLLFALIILSFLLHSWHFSSSFSSANIP